MRTTHICQGARLLWQPQWYCRPRILALIFIKINAHLICCTAKPLNLIPYSRESPPMGAASYFLTKQGGWALFRVFPHSTSKERPPLFTYTSSNSCDRAASARESKPSQHIYIAGVTSNITAHHVVFAAAKRWLRSSVEAAGPSSAQASQATHMDTIDTDTQTNRDLLQGGSYLRYAGTSH